MGAQPAFFDLKHRYERLSRAGGGLERRVSTVNFEALGYLLEKALQR